jgi:hypothetical protein
MAAAISNNGAHIAAIKNCINSADPVPTTARLPIMTSAIVNAAANGKKAAQPNIAKFGRKISTTPPNATALAIQVALEVRSPKKTAEINAVIIGHVNCIATASANGIR